MVTKKTTEKMNKLIIYLLFIIGTSQIFSQNINDALRYSSDNVEGSARFAAMSGAFGALGGELSAISINPAGSAIYNKGVVSLSFSNNSITNDSDLQNNSLNSVMQSNISKKNNINFNQIGAVLVFNNIEEKSKWRKIAISLNYEQTNNNFNEFQTSGINSNGIDSYFLSYANGLAFDQISAFDGETITQAYSEIGSSYGYANQQAFLGYESFIIDPEGIDNPNNSSYYSNVNNTNSSGYYQDYYFKSRGYNGKLSANIAFQYLDNLYFGMNLNSHFIDYDQATYLQETTATGDLPALGLSIDEINFENNLSVIGEGFSVQIGAIAKVNDLLRLGISYDIFEDYKLQTPSKITASGALVFKKICLISFDYSVKDYSSIKFKPTNEPYFIEQNNLISNSLNKTISYRIGAEILQNRMSYRAGYKFEENPRGLSSHDLTGFSFGLGYKINNSRIDLSFEKFNLKNTHQMYDAGSLGNINLDTTNSIIKLTVVSIL